MIGRLRNLFQKEQFWNYSAVASEFIGTAILGILQSMLVVRQLPKAEYGQYCYTTMLVSYLLFISSWAMMFMAAKEYSQRRDQIPQTLAAVVQTRLLITLPLAVAAIFLPLFVPESSTATAWVVFFGYIGILINCFGGDLIYLFMALEKQRVGAAIGLGNAVLNLAALFVMSRLPSGVHQANVAAAMIFGPLITATIGLIVAKRILKIDSFRFLHFQWAEIRQFLRNGLTLMPGRVAVQIYSTTAMVLCGIYLTLDEVAVFRVGAAFAAYITSAAMLSNRITQPALIREAVDLESEGFHRAAYQHTYYLCLVAFGAIVGTFGFGGWLLELVYGERYRVSETVTFWIVFQLLGMAFLNGLDTVLYARGMNKQISLILMSGVAAGAISGFLLIPTFRVLGAGITVFIITSTVHLVEIPFLPKKFRWFWVRPSLLPLASMAAGLGLIAYFKIALPQSPFLPIIGAAVLGLYFIVAAWPILRSTLRANS